MRYSLPISAATDYPNFTLLRMLDVGVAAYPRSVVFGSLNTQYRAYSTLYVVTWQVILSGYADNVHQRFPRIYKPTGYTPGSRCRFRVQ